MSPVPAPHKDEAPDMFMHRCMGDEKMMKEFPDQKQRVAVCMTSWKDSKKGKDSNNSSKDKKKKKENHPNETNQY